MKNRHMPVNQIPWVTHSLNMLSPTNHHGFPPQARFLHLRVSSSLKTVSL